MEDETNRRRYLQLLGASTTLALAGCSGGGDSGDDGSDDGGSDDGGSDDGGSDDGGSDDGGSDDGGSDDGGSDDGMDDGGSDDGTGDGDDSDDGDDDQSGSPRLRDTLNFEQSYVAEINSDQLTATWRVNGSEYYLSGTSGGEEFEVYSINTDSGTEFYSVSGGQCVVLSTNPASGQNFDPADPVGEVPEVTATGTTTLDGTEVYEYDVAGATYYVRVSDGRLVRFELDDGSQVIEFSSWGEVPPITPPDMECQRP